MIRPHPKEGVCAQPRFLKRQFPPPAFPMPTRTSTTPERPRGPEIQKPDLGRKSRDPRSPHAPQTIRPGKTPRHYYFSHGQPSVIEARWIGRPRRRGAVHQKHPRLNTRAFAPVREAGRTRSGCSPFCPPPHRAGLAPGNARRTPPARGHRRLRRHRPSNAPTEPSCHPSVVALAGIGGGILVGLIAANPRRISRTSTTLRTASGALIALISVANAWSTAELVIGSDQRHRG